MPTTTGVATEFITFTRASNATVTDSDGKVKWAPANLLTNSESFDAASWTKDNLLAFGSGSSANAIGAPNATTTADLITPDTAGTVHRIFMASGITVPTATPHTYGVFVRANGYTKVALRENATTGDYAAFELTGAGSVLDKTVGATASVSALSNSWYYITATFSSAATNIALGVYVLSPSYTTGSILGVWVANGTSGIYLWGAHLYRSDLAMQPNTSAYPMYNPTTPKNLLGYTQDFSSWSTYNATPTANTTAAPNGLTTADTLTGTIDTSQHLAYRQYTAFVNATAYKLSVFAKAGTNNFLYIGAQAFGGAIFDLANGVVGSNISGGIGSIQSIGNGWYRCIVSVTATGTSSQIDVGVAPSGTNSSGPATGTIYLWGAQLSDSASLDTYAPVYGAAVTSAAYYGPRRDFDPVTLACKGLLVEEQRVNLQLNSNVFGTSTFAATVVAGAAASPSGLTDASSVACTSVGGRAILSTSVTSGIVYTFSVFIKAGTNTSAYIELAGTAGSGGAVVFNLSSGTVTSGTGGAIVPAPNGFYRCSVTSTATGTGASDMRIGTGDATSKTVFVYGAQLEANASFATSYIPTGAATATRNADVASVSTQAFPYSATEGTVVVNYDRVGIQSFSRLFTLGDAAANSQVSILNYTTGQENPYFVTSGVQTIVTGPSIPAANAVSKMGLAFKTGDNAYSLNGATATANATSFTLSATALSLGNVLSVYQLNGHIRQITYLPRRLSNADLQARTA